MAEHTSKHKNQLSFQNHWAKHYGGKILNVGCKEDPAGIHECSDDVTNLDILTEDSYTKASLKGVKGFINADFLEWAPDAKYDTLVLGEVLEHCDEVRIVQFIKRSNKALKMDGIFIITCPQDGRSKEVQHDGTGLFVVREGVTSWHQSYITKEYLYEKLISAKFVIDHYESKMWLPEENVFWHFVVARKMGEV